MGEVVDYRRVVVWRAARQSKRVVVQFRVVLHEQWTSWSGGPLHGDAHQSPSAARAVIDGQPTIDEAANRLRRTQ